MSAKFFSFRRTNRFIGNASSFMGISMRFPSSRVSNVGTVRIRTANLLGKSDALSLTLAIGSGYLCSRQSENYVDRLLTRLLRVLVEGLNLVSH